MAIVSLQNVWKTYPMGKTEVHAVNGVSFEIEKGDFVSIVGPSGSGKSTILNLIGCIDVPTSGTVCIDGRETGALSERETTQLRHATIGFIFQSFNLLPVLNVYENVEFPVLLGKGDGLRKRRAEARDHIDHLIESVGLSQWRRHRPNELSGGQRQRVAIARALATQPQIVLADEPTANLDSSTGQEIIELMKRINHELHTTFIFSTHDREIFSIADHIIRLKDGTVLENERSGGLRKRLKAAVER